jgi:hypothetical protein
MKIAPFLLPTGFPPFIFLSDSFPAIFHHPIHFPPFFIVRFITRHFSSYNSFPAFHFLVRFLSRHFHRPIYFPPFCLLRPELEGFVSIDDLSKDDFDVTKVYRTVSPALAFQVRRKHFFIALWLECFRKLKDIFD